MRHPVAQAVALACHANAALAGLPTAPFLEGNSTAGSCERITFTTEGGGLLRKSAPAICAATPDEWFAWLAKSGARQAVLDWVPTGQPAFAATGTRGFLGAGGHWLLETWHAGGHVMRWLARWELYREAAPDGRRWRVDYARQFHGRSEPRPAADLGVARAQLGAALEDVQAFARSHQLTSQAQAFARAHDTLATGALHGEHRDLAPDGALGPDACTVLDACQSAWVFGDRGGWDELSFEGQDQKDYLLVTDALFRRVLAAVPAAVGDRAPAHGPTS